MTPEERAELRRIAENATPGPWDLDEDDYVITAMTPSFVSEEGGFATYPTMFVEADEVTDLRYLAAFDPPTVLRLLDRVDELEAAQRRVHAIAESSVYSGAEVAVLLHLGWRPPVDMLGAGGEQA